MSIDKSMIFSTTCGWFSVLFPIVLIIAMVIGSFNFPKLGEVLEDNNKQIEKITY